MKFVTSIISLGVLLSCCGTQTSVDDNFLSGTMVYSSLENDCAYTIKVSENEDVYFFDPINLEDKYMKDGLKIQFQHRPLRVKKRCDKANPISITKMKSL